MPRFSLSSLTAAVSGLCLAVSATAPQAQPAASSSTPTNGTPSATPASAERPEADKPQALSVDALLDIVLTHNPELIAAQQGRIGALAGVQTASAYANPRVEWQTGRNQARMPGTPAGSVQGWGISQLIENPAARSARIDAAQAYARGSGHAVALTRNSVASETRLLAKQYLLRRAEATVSEENLALLEQVRERVQLRVRSGEAARYELIKADAEIVHARERLQTARLQAEQVLVALNRLAAGKLPARWTLSGALDDALPLPALTDLQQLAETDNPELRALQTEVERAEAQLRGARASRLPGVEVRVGQTNEPEVRQSTVGFNVQIPLFDQREGAIGEASADLERLRGRLAGRRAEMREQVRLAWQALEIASLRVQALREGVVKDAEAALRVAQAAYQFGERGILDVLDAQRVLRSARADLLQARFQVQAARIELDTLAGRHAVQPATQP
ncbi:TolC family protein [uncultured Aquabacterium sp.]|uniref:TolC family protein n=1 Tax=uncultured Aquabacterium sp. TaxID=158753 RepID=UPI0025E38C6F|nr:TolC family protein [uncultured Aquabacterium sp.]